MAEPVNRTRNSMPPWRVSLGLAGAAIGGLGAVVAGGRPHHPGLFERVRAGVESGAGLSALLLIGIGMVAWYITRVSPFLVGATTMSLLPIIAILEVAFVDPTSHNLLPFEFVLYAFGALPGFLGAWLAQRAWGSA